MQVLVEKDGVLGAGQVGAVGVGAVPQNDADGFRVVFVFPQAGVQQSRPRQFQGVKLVRLAAGGRYRDDAEALGIEAGQVSQKAAALHVQAGRFAAVGIEIVIGAPIRQRLVDGVHLVEDIGPIGRHVRRLGKQARHADDGDVRLIRSAHVRVSASASRSDGPSNDPSG